MKSHVEGARMGLGWRNSRAPLWAIDVASAVRTSQTFGTR